MNNAAEQPAVRGRRISVIGAARSGIAVARLLHAAGAAVFVSERTPRETLPGADEMLKDDGINHEFGGNTPRVLEADLVVVSPGVPSDAPMVVEALARGIRVVSELEVASWFCAGEILAITGTNGKTTTTTLAGRMFDDAHRSVVVAGNIGTALSQVVDRITPESVAVLEVSSFQLDFADTFRPRVAVVLNITPDHLDRYEHSVDKYIAAKCKVFARQGEGDVLIYNDDDPVTRAEVARRAPAAVPRLPFSTRRNLQEGAWVSAGRVIIGVKGTSMDIVGAEEIGIRGEHNLSNALAAALAATMMGIPPASLGGTLRAFTGVEHRLERVRDVDGVAYVNDSKATNVDSVWYALQSFRQPIIVMLGGRDKGNDYARLVEPVRRHVKAIVAIGESAETVVGAFTGIVPVVRAASMEEAVRTGRRLASPGDVVLLSPACASFDWFENYEHRGRTFKEIVMALQPFHH
jgi:UDP-N-acetylmuramoylalanine--D-glutamate ligase